MSRDFSRDETEWGSFGDCWGAAPPSNALSAVLAGGAIKTSSIVAKPTKAALLFQSVQPAKPTAPRTAPVSSSGAQDPRTLDFTTGQTDLSTTTVKAAALPLPVLTVAQQQAADAAKVRADAAWSSAINAKYRAERGADDRDTIRISNESQAYQRAHMNGIDWGLIPLGAKVLGTGAAIIATAGTAAVAVAGAGVSAATLGSLVTADGLVAAASKVGGKDAAAAVGVIEDTKALADGGHVDAQKGLAVIAAVTADRVAKGVPPGVVQTQAALVPLASNPVIAEATAKGRLGFQSGFTSEQLAELAPKSPIVSTKKTVDFRLAPDTVMPSAAALAAAADARLRWTVLDSGKIYRGAAPSGAGALWRVYDSGRVARSVA